MIYITEQEALEMGFTHEGTLFGVPAWFAGDEDCPWAVPKFLPFVLWIKLCDLAYDAATYFVRPYECFVIPMHIKRRIQ